MHSWRDKVTDKLSRLLPDSRSSTSADQTQARSYSEEGKSLSSVFSFILPSASFRSNRSKSSQSHPFIWNNKSSPWQDEPLDGFQECIYKYEPIETRDLHEEDGDNGFAKSTECEKKRTLDTLGEEEHGSARSTSGSERFEDANDSHSSEKAMLDLTDRSLFISQNLYEFFQSSLPNIVKGCQWVLLYSTVKHGISLRTLIRKSGDLSGPCLLITADKQGAVFGGLLECPLRPTAKRKYQGTNQTFVFTTIYGEPRLFRPTG